jgi:hypothetical protein
MSEEINNKFKIDTNYTTIEFEYRTCLLTSIKNMLEKMSYPVDPKILDPNSCCDISEVKNIYDILLDRKEHIRQEKEYYKFMFIFGNTIDKNIKIPNDDELKKYCYGTKEFYDNYKN